MHTIKLFLASQSPRRKMLLETLGLAPVVIPADPSADAEALEAPLPKEDPIHYVQRIALAKRDQGLSRVHACCNESAPRATDLILAADTTVALDQELFGKPQGPEHAIDMLQKLSGKTHEVHTAVSITRVDASHQQSLLVSSQVTFAPLPKQWILDYVNSGEPLDKAGAYGIQGMAQTMIPHISGSYSSIVGLPLYETWQAIQRFE
jgi:septum formation protein